MGVLRSSALASSLFPCSRVIVAPVSGTAQLQQPTNPGDKRILCVGSHSNSSSLDRPICKVVVQRVHAQTQTPSEEEEPHNLESEDDSALALLAGADAEISALDRARPGELEPQDEVCRSAVAAAEALAPLLLSSPLLSLNHRRAVYSRGKILIAMSQVHQAAHLRRLPPSLKYDGDSSNGLSQANVAALDGDEEAALVVEPFAKRADWLAEAARDAVQCLVFIDKERQNSSAGATGADEPTSHVAESLRLDMECKVWAAAVQLQYGQLYDSATSTDPSISEQSLYESCQDVLAVVRALSDRTVSAVMIDELQELQIFYTNQVRRKV